VTPEIVDAIALILWFVRLSGPLDNGLVRLVVGDSLFSIGVVTLIVRARVSGQDETLEEAAADLYATPWNRFRQITLPLVMPAVIAGLLLAFSLALDNVIISSFVALPGYTPWSAYVLSAVRAILRPEIAAMATVLLGLTLCALGLVALVLRRTGDSSADIARTMAGAG
jgi:ABC-type spermidine/putrescine transport system permease subunit II